MIDISIKMKAIQSLAPQAIFGVMEDGSIDWQSSDIPQPSNSAIEAEIERVKANEDMLQLRILRNRKLSSCDWTQIGDVPEQTKLLWQPYRQQLRDITNNYTSLSDVVWPTKPEENN